MKAQAIMETDFNTLEGFTESYLVSSHPPSQLSLGAQWFLNDDSGWSSELKYAFWQEVDPDYNGNISGSLFYNRQLAIPRLLSLGLLYAPASYQVDVMPEVANNAVNAIFAVIASRSNLGNQIIIDTALGSSYGLSDPWRGALFINLGLSWGH